MSQAASPDAVVVLGTDVSGFSAGIEAAQASLTRWGEGVLASVASVGERMLAVWARVGDGLANPIGTLLLPLRAAAVAADGLATVLMAPLKAIPLVGSAVASAVKGVYDAGAAVVGLIPAAVEGLIGFVEKAADTVGHVAEKLGELSEMTAQELGNTVGAWGGQLTEWLASKVFGKSFAKRIGDFLGEELGVALAEILADDVDGIGTAVEGHLAEATGHAQTLAAALRESAEAFRAVRTDAADTWDNVLRDARQTARDIRGIWQGFGIGQVIAEDVKEGFEQAGKFAERAIEEVEGLFGRALVRLADLIDRTVERFRAPIAAAFDLAQSLLEKIGLIDAGGAKWGDSIRNAASVGQELILKVVGGAAQVAGVMKQVLGKAADVLVGLMDVVKDVTDLFNKRNGLDKAWDLVKAGQGPAGWGLQAGSKFGLFGQGELKARMEGVAAGWIENGHAAARRVRYGVEEGPGGFSTALSKARSSLEEFAKEAAAENPEEWAKQARAFVEKLMRDQMGKVADQDNLFRALKTTVPEPPKIPLPEIPKELGMTSRSVLANSQEAANLVARAQLNLAGRPLEQVAQAAKEQVAQQKKMAALLDKIDQKLDRLGVT